MRRPRNAQSAPPLRRSSRNESSLFINIGTTTEEVATALTSHQNLLVITNNLNVAMALYRHPTIEVIVAGGLVRRSDGAVVGSSAVDLIRQFKVDVAVIGASALDDDGSLLDYDPREVNVSRAIIDNARRVFLVCDQTKLERARAGQGRPHIRNDAFVTDRLTSAKLRDVCAAHSVKVIETATENTAATLEKLTEPPVNCRAPLPNVGDLTALSQYSFQISKCALVRELLFAYGQDDHKTNMSA